MQRCKALSKRSREQCKNYAIKNHSLCRMHGARGGPKTEQGYRLCKKASIKHGLYSCETLREFKRCRQLMKRMGIR